MEKSLIEKNIFLNTEELTSQVKKNLSARLDSNSHYTEKEINDVSILDKGICQENQEIYKDTQELIRSLFRLSLCELKTTHKISSHRKLIGPIIVIIKKICWRLIRFNLNETFQSLQHFNILSTYTLAKQAVEIDLIKTNYK